MTCSLFGGWGNLGQNHESDQSYQNGARRGNAVAVDLEHLSENDQRTDADKVVMPAGAAILNTLPKKEPFIRFLFGSRERTKEGAPIVNRLINVI